MHNDLLYQQVKPPEALAAFVDSFWMLHNPSGEGREVIILPDGRIDLFFARSATEPFHVTLMGLGTGPDEAVVAPGALMYAISFNLPAAEYILQQPVGRFLDSAINMPAGFWDFSVADLDGFQRFCDKAVQKIQALLPGGTDGRKLRLFELLYATRGAISVQELADKVFWSARQINRYFRQQYGMPLKTYCNLLRFRASFTHIKEGKLFPQEDFTDQAHFIKQVKKFSGTVPKELFRNRNDRFIQFSTLRQK